MFSPLTFKGIINMVGFILGILLFVFFRSHVFFDFGSSLLALPMLNIFCAAF